MTKFSKSEAVSIIVIFLILIGISWPNFSLSLRRSRDQIRRDDMGNLQAAIDKYYIDYGSFPLSSAQGQIIGCSAAGKVDVNLVACNWGRDTWISLIPGVDREYMKILAVDPDLNKGASYIYFSDGSRYQLFGALEGIDEPGYDKELAARGVLCGTRVCNMGRANNVPLYISIEDYNFQIHCAQVPNDPKCINRQITK